jgi:hypothetical protein
MKTKSLLFAAILIIAITGCKKDDPQTTPDDTTQVGGKGAYILNEGSWGVGNGSVSYYSTANDVINADVFAAVNGHPLGDVVQSMTIFNGKGYIVVNASNKIEVVTIADFKSTATLGSLINPRYFIGVSSSKGYVSQWNSTIGVMDLSTNTITKSIIVGNSPERMLAYNSKVYVTNSNGYGQDSTISIINTTTDVVDKTIVVGDDPKALVKDKNNKLWVLCGGTIIYDNITYEIISQTFSKLVRIDPVTDVVEAAIPISDTLHPANLAISPDGNTLYYGGGYGFVGIYAMQITDLTAPSTPFINSEFYGFGVNDVNGEIYGCIASGSNNGSLNRYQANGTLIRQYTVGVFPNGATFNMN